MSVMVICKFPTPCWYARNVQQVIRNNTINQGSVTLDDSLNRFEAELARRKEIDNEIINFIQQAPPLTPALEKTPYGRVYNLLTEAPEPFVKASRIAFGNDLLIRLAAHLGN